MSINQCKVLALPKLVDSRGSLTFIEGTKHIPFAIKRIFYIYDLPIASSRGAHAHKECEQFIICLSGALDVHLDDGCIKRVVSLNKPWEGLYIPPYTWASEENFASGSLYLVLASHDYDPTDYINNYDSFSTLTKYPRE